MTTDIATIPEVPARSTAPALSNLRQAMMTLTSEQMDLALSEFTERRNTFRRWLMSQLKEGVHYGFPPGCAPRNDVNEKQWKQKQSLYKAGADFLVELLGWRCTFTSDMQTWEQLGKPATICILCHIFDGAGNPVGEGRGGRSRGEKKMADNANIKMAEKCAKVNAVIHALSLSDLFSQDEDEWEPPKHENPAANRNAPRQQPRTVRIEPKDLSAIMDLWKSNNKGATKDAWAEFVGRVLGKDFNVFKPHEWTLQDFETVRDAVNAELVGDMPIPY